MHRPALHPHNLHTRRAHVRVMRALARMHSHFTRYLSLRLTDARSRFSCPVCVEIMSPIVALRLAHAEVAEGSAVDITAGRALPRVIRRIDISLENTPESKGGTMRSPCVRVLCAFSRSPMRDKSALKRRILRILR